MKLKRKLILLFFITAVYGCLNSAERQQIVTETITGFSFRLPDGWQLDSKISTDKSQRFVFKDSPKNIGYLIVKKSTTDDVKKYVDEVVQKWSALHVTKRETHRIGNRDIEVVFCTSNYMPMRFIEFYVMSAGNVCIVQFNLTETDCETLLTGILNSMDSIRVDVPERKNK